MAPALSWFSLGPVPEQVPPPGYAYKCEDLGYLKPWLYRFCVTPLSRVTPPSVVANDITLLAQLCSLAPVIVFLLFAETAPWWVISFVPGAGLILYTILDHLDGTQARKTGTSGPLGEFLDHWLDGWNGGLVTLGVAIAWGSTPVVAATLATWGAFAYAIAIAEQRVTGVLKLDRMSGNEGMFLIAWTYLGMGTMGRQEIIEFHIWREYTVAHMFQFLCWWGCVGTVKNVWMREGFKRTLPDCGPLLIGGALSIAWGAAGLDARIAGLIASVVGAIAAGRIVLAITAGIAVKWDALGLASIVAGLLYTLAAHPDARSTQLAGLLVLGILVLRALADFAWALEAFARFVRRGEVLSMFAPRPSADLEKGSEPTA